MNEGIEEVDVRTLKIDENSRLRIDFSDLGVLMESIKQVGVLEPILVRRKDKVIICGNRRLEASKKLGNRTIPVIWKDNVSDEDLLIMNLTENIQRKAISSMEIGRVCNILADKGLNIAEISTRLSLPMQRVKICITAFKRTPEEFKNKIKYVQSGRDKGAGIPESVFWGIVRMNRYKKLTDDEYNLLLKKALDEGWAYNTIKTITELIRRKKSIKDAIKMADEFSTVHLIFSFNKEKLQEQMRKMGLVSVSDFIRQLIFKIDEDLVI